MTSRELLHQLSELRQFDSSLAISPDMHSKLGRRLIKPSRYSREVLFSAMARGKICLFHDYPAPIAEQDSAIKKIHSAVKNVSRNRKIAVRCGPSGTTKYLTTRELMRRWQEERGMVCITDLHIRDSTIEKHIDLAKLSWFNLLPECDEQTALEEMMTMVVSSRGSISDSHSDTPDGSNHCFEGRKIWLMWETFEGFEHGLEDCSRNHVTSNCSFDMARFLSLASARWLSIGPGETLFLPGDYTHKVITIEKYIGAGSFYVSLPNCLRSLSRWINHGPLWSLESSGCDDQLILQIGCMAQRKIRQLKSAGKLVQKRAGYDFLDQSLRAWRRATPKGQQAALCKIPGFADYLSYLPVKTI